MSAGTRSENSIPMDGWEVHLKAKQAPGKGLICELRHVMSADLVLTEVDGQHPSQCTSNMFRKQQKARDHIRQAYGSKADIAEVLTPVQLKA